MLAHHVFFVLSEFAPILLFNPHFQPLFVPISSNTTQFMRVSNACVANRDETQVVALKVELKTNDKAKDELEKNRASEDDLFVRVCE